MRVLLLQAPDHPERIVAQAARLCYSAATIETIGEQLTPEKIAERVSDLVAMGHWSALEHASFTFGIEGISRALTHQLVRHRLASYSQQSQRYVAMKDFPYVIPPALSKRPDMKESYQKVMADIGRVYQEMLDAGVKAEDARYILPNACESKIIVTMNARELLHFFQLRCCNRAQWEIHDMADDMLRLAKKPAPTIFRNAGPGCLHGACPEGKMTCGKIAEVRVKYNRF